VLSLLLGQASVRSRRTRISESNEAGECEKTRSGSGHPSAVVDENDGRIDEIMDRERMEGRRLPSLQSNRRKVLLDDL